MASSTSPSSPSSPLSMSTLANPTVKRYRDWPIRWVEFIKDCQDVGSDLRLDWEDMNCIQWACQGIEALTGHDYYAEFAGTKGALGAVRRIREEGFNTLDHLIGSILKEVPIAMAHQGDLVLVRTEAWDNLVQDGHAVMPHGVALADPPFFWCVTPEGLGKGELYMQGVKAFAVGRVVL